MAAVIIVPALAAASLLAGATGGSAAVATPTGGPVPAGTSATSVSFISTQAAFVLGTAPCAHRPCTVILRTLDRGQTWQGLPAPRESISYPGGKGLWGLRFADASQGFAYGDGLWGTSDGGASWHPASIPGRYVFELEPVGDRQLVAVTAACSIGSSNCPDELSIYHRPLAGGRWRYVASSGRLSFDESIAVHGRDVWALAGERLMVSTDGGSSFASHAQPCPARGRMLPMPTAIADDGVHTYLLCIGQGFTGHTVKFLYRTTGTRSGWTLVGRPPAAGDGGELAAGSDSAVVIATASAASWLYGSDDGGHRWTTPLSYPDGGEGWADLGFTTATDGVVIHGPAQKDGGDAYHPGQLQLSDDGGRRWSSVRF